MKSAPEKVSSVKIYDSPYPVANPEGGVCHSFLMSMYTGSPIYERPAKMLKTMNGSVEVCNNTNNNVMLL